MARLLPWNVQSQIIIWKINEYLEIRKMEYAKYMELSYNVFKNLK